MKLLTSIANLGAPKQASPEQMAQLRAEKARAAAAVEQRETLRLRSLADYIEQHPDEAMAQATAYVTRFCNSPAHSRLHASLAKWQDLLSTRSATQIANLLRESGEASRELRETSPFARPQTHQA